MWLERDKQNGDLGDVLASQSAAALMHPCLLMIQKTFRIALDTADFVRHVPFSPFPYNGLSEGLRRANFFWCIAAIKALTAKIAIEEYWVSRSQLRLASVS
jgi:hypothetical protein